MGAAIWKLGSKAEILVKEKKEMQMRMCASVILALVPLGSVLFAATGYTFVAIPNANNSIQTDLVNTFPEGTFTANNPLATQFNIASVPATCGYTGAGACNFYDAFGWSGNGLALTIAVSIPRVTHVYTVE